MSNLKCITRNTGAGKLPVLLMILTLGCCGALATPTSITGATVSGSGSCLNNNASGMLIADQKGDLELVINKRITSIGPCYLEITVSSTVNFDSSLHISESVTNASGVRWTDFHFEFGHFNQAGDFVRSDDSDNMHFRNDLDIDPRIEPPQSNSFTWDGSNAGIHPDVLDFNGGTGIGPNGIGTFDFDLALKDAGPGAGDGKHTFVLMQTPTIPEPTTLSVVALALVGLRCCKRRS